MKCFIRGLFFGALVLTLPRCASTPDIGKNGTALLDQDSQVTTDRQSPQLMKKGARIPLSDNAVLVESPGHVGVLLFPTGSPAQDLHLALRPIETWGGEEFDRRLNADLSSIMSKVSEIQVLIQASRRKEALDKIEDLQKAHPKIVWLNFLKASCLVLLGENARAQAALETALTAFPNDPAGLQLYSTVTGREFREPAARKNNN